MSYQLHVAEYLLELCIYVFRTDKQNGIKNRQAKRQVGSVGYPFCKVVYRLDVPSHDLPCKKNCRQTTSMYANLGHRFPLFGYVQSLDQTNRMHGSTESKPCSSDYSAICSKEIDFLRTVPAQDVDGGVLLITYVLVHSCVRRDHRIGHRTHKEQFMCDICGYYGHV